jgi:hypothetical protein
MLEMRHRVHAFEAAFPKNPASWPRVTVERGQPVVYATWVMGNDYRAQSTLYGAYPPGLLPRIMALYGVPVNPEHVLHAFSGSLLPGPYVRLDINPDREPDIVGDVCDAPSLLGGDRFDLVVADPPYTRVDAERYGTPMVNRRKAIAALAEVTRPGGWLCWLDTQWPIHRKAQWRTCGRVTVIRSTNHRVRLMTIFERQP